MTEALFRQEVTDARRHRLAGTVIAAVPPSSRFYTGIVVAIAVVGVGLLAFGSYAGTTAVPGVIAFDAGVARVHPRSAGEVARVHVRPGQIVAAGAPLVTLALAQGGRGLADQIGELDRQLAEIDRQLSLAGATEDTGKAALREQRAGLAATAASLDRQRGIALAQVGLAESNVARSTRLAREGAGSVRGVEDARATLLSRRSDAEALGERLIATRTSLADVSSKLAQGALDAGRDRSLLVAQRAALLGQRADLARSDRIVLTAPVAGAVADLTAELGRHVTPQQSVATVVPAGSALEVWLYAPSRAVGFTRTGDRVRLRFDAFPYQKYGFGRGTIAGVSQVAIDPATLETPLDVKEPVFRVRVRLDRDMRLADPAALIRPGMSLSADLVQTRRPLWALLFGPIAGRMGG